MSAARRTAIVYPLAALVLLALLFAWQRGAYPNYAEGVYLFSARLILDGALPYRDFIAAHPPLLFYAGAAILAVWDSIDGARLLLSLVNLATGGLVATAVLRLTGNWIAAVIGGVAALIAPWSLHEHAMLMPETFGALVLMGAALLAARARTAVWAGLLAAGAVGFKWPFLLCGLALAVVTPARFRFLAALAGGFAGGVLVSFAVFGADRLYEQLVVAQQDVGWHTLRIVAGYTVQAAWNLLPLLVPAAFAVLLGRRARDRALLRTLIAFAAAALVLVATITKTGTYLNAIALAEPPLVALASAGVVWLMRAPRPRWAPAAIVAALALGVAQVGAFLAAPDEPGFFLRPFSAHGHAWVSEEETGRAVAAARACPAGVPYSGHPYMAFVARRRMPGDEPDQFLMVKTPVGAPALAEASAEPERCP